MSRDITPAAPGSTTRTEHENPWALGQWYWVTDQGGEWFGCIMEIGSNYVELHSPHSSNGYSTERVHLDHFWTRLRAEPNAEQVIASRITQERNRLDGLLDAVRDLTARLGVAPTTSISGPADASGGNALAVLSQQIDTTAYKADLVKAKNQTLPDLFKEIERATTEMTRWMSATSMAVKAMVKPMKKSIGAIEDRIDTLGLYAGLSEDAKQCCDGAPAAWGERLHVMQRRLYMDEECLLSYEAGGMDIQNIAKFDEWISRPANRDRVLPFQRCLVAFRVRRKDKEREDGGNFLSAYINIQLKEADKTTFLYIRNGEQVWRINNDFDFGPMLVPDQSEFDPSQPQMIKLSGSRFDKLVPLSEYQHLKEKYVEAERLSKEWDDSNPDVEDKWFRNPHRNYIDFSEREWTPFDPSSVHFDEATAFIEKKMKEYNRVAVIIQGLFDRSLILHPHPPVQVWRAESFEASIKVIYDATSLTSGSPPDFAAYRQGLNQSITKDSVLTGQNEHWQRVEADRENKRQAEDYRNSHRSMSNFTRYKPYGNPGPTDPAPPTDWKPRSRKATFRWRREAQSPGRYGEMIAAVIEVPDSSLLNVSAYKPGDYLQFFEDARTRADYLKWAPLLLAAEDYHGRQTAG